MATTEQIDELVALQQAIVLKRADYQTKKPLGDAAAAADLVVQNELKARVAAGADPNSAPIRALIASRVATYAEGIIKTQAAQTAFTAIATAEQAFEDAVSALAFP